VSIVELFILFYLVKSDKQQIISNDLTSKVAWNSSAFLGPNLWDKDQFEHVEQPTSVKGFLF
jgi:hypothetical protein